MHAILSSASLDAHRDTKRYLYYPANNCRRNYFLLWEAE